MCAQSAALASEHHAHHATDHCCLLCHIGVLPFLQVASEMPVAPDAAVGWLTWEPGSGLFHDGLLVSKSSRAPPLA